MLFLTVFRNIPNSKVCLKGESSIGTSCCGDLFLWRSLIKLCKKLSMVVKYLRCLVTGLDMQKLRTYYIYRIYSFQIWLNSSTSLAVQIHWYMEKLFKLPKHYLLNKSQINLYIHLIYKAIKINSFVLLQ